jgi:hypothetical protein
MSEVAIILVIELIYVYMYKLIVDIDDPFEYEEGVAQGAAEVTLFPLENYMNRLKQRIASEEPQRVSVASTV